MTVLRARASHDVKTAAGGETRCVVVPIGHGFLVMRQQDIWLILVVMLVAVLLALAAHLIWG
jgi:hypothetical protein